MRLLANWLQLICQYGLPKDGNVEDVEISSSLSQLPRHVLGFFSAASLVYCEGIVV